MKKILVIVLSGFWFVASYGQTAGVPSNITSNQALRSATSKQTGGTLPVLKLVPVTTSGKYTFSQGQYLTNDGLMNGFMRLLPDGTYGLAVDGSLIGAGGGGAVSSVNGLTGAVTVNAANTLTTAAITVGSTVYPINTPLSTVVAAINANTPTNAILNTQLTAKGALISSSAANTPVTLPVGTANQVLTVDLTTPTGLKWAAPASTTVEDVLTSTVTTNALSANQGKVLQDTKHANITYQNATVQSAAAGVATTINFTGGITSTLAGSTLTVNVPPVAALVQYEDDTAAGVGAVAIGSTYYVSVSNPYGLPQGSVKVRIN